VGNVTTGSLLFGVEYQDYNLWRPATADELTTLISARGSLTPAAFLMANGFQNATGKLVITGDTFSYNMQANYSGDAVCFLDMDLNVNVVCSNDSLESFYTTIEGCDQWNPFYVNSDIATTSKRNEFYNFYLTSDSTCDRYWYDESPGWEDEFAGEANAQQFRWPALSISDLTCTSSRPTTNPGGVPTRCGDDFDAWFDSQVARPPACTGTVFGVCS